MLGVDAATHCRSDRENDRHGDCRSGGDDDRLPGDLLMCGCKGGRQEEGDVEIKLESSSLLLQPELLKVSPRRKELLLELASFFDIPPPLLFKG